MTTYTEGQINKIIELRKEGKGVTQIGRELNLDRGAISRLLKNLGYSTDRNPIIKDIFSKIDSEEKAYWLGMLYSDGSINKINGQVELGLQAKDIKHLEKFKKFLKCNNKISYNKNSNSYRLSFCCSQITEDLIKLGCTPQKSLVIKFPTDEQVPRKFKKDFMRGFIDGDGCLCYTDKTYYLGFTSTEDFINEAIKYFNWKSCKLYSSGQAKTWRCADKKLVPNYLKTLYENSIIYLDRKYEKYLEMININTQF